MTSLEIETKIRRLKAVKPITNLLKARIDSLKRSLQLVKKQEWLGQ